MANFSSAAFLVSSLIHGRVLMSSPRDFSRAATSLSMLALASGGKFSFTQSCPTASPRAWSVIEVHSRQRGVGSFCPPSTLPKKEKSSSRKALGRPSAEVVRVCQRKYDFHASTGSEPISVFTSLKKSGVETLRLSKERTFTSLK